MAARSKTRKNWKLFPEFFKSEFSILAIFGNYIEQKTRTWEFATLSFLKKKFFIILTEVIPYMFCIIFESFESVFSFIKIIK